MAMSYTSLVAPKGTTGSVLNWVGYSKIDVPTIVDEAQFLLYETLRVREMRTEYIFGLDVNECDAGLPTRFLDPIGKIYDITNSCYYPQVLETGAAFARNYDNSLSGTFGTDPFNTNTGQGLVFAQLAAHPFTQGSTITIPNGPTVNGLPISGTFPVVGIFDANSFFMDVGNNFDLTANATGFGGGSGVTFTGNKLISGSPSRWAIWNETIHFDVSLDIAAQYKLLYYRRPQLLSVAKATNFLTDRYPKLLRVACLAAAAEYMKDDNEYQKQTSALAALIQNTAIENDFIMRGGDFGTDTP